MALGPAPNWTVDDYAGHWLPAFQTGAAVGARRRAQDLDEAQFEEEKRKTQAQEERLMRQDTERAFMESQIADAIKKRTPQDPGEYQGPTAAQISEGEAMGMDPGMVGQVTRDAYDQRKRQWEEHQKNPTNAPRWSMSDLPPETQARIMTEEPELYGRLRGQEYAEAEAIRRDKRAVTEDEIQKKRLEIEQRRADSQAWEEFFQAMNTRNGAKPPKYTTKIDEFGRQTQEIETFGGPPPASALPAPQVSNKDKSLLDAYDATIGELESWKKRRAAGDTSAPPKVELDFDSEGKPKLNKEWSLWPYFLSNDEDLDIQINRLKIMRERMAPGKAAPQSGTQPAGTRPNSVVPGSTYTPPSNTQTNRFRFQVGPGGTLR